MLIMAFVFGKGLVSGYFIFRVNVPVKRALNRVRTINSLCKLLFKSNFGKKVDFRKIDVLNYF